MDAELIRNQYGKYVHHLLCSWDSTSLKPDNRFLVLLNVPLE